MAEKKSNKATRTTKGAAQPRAEKARSEKASNARDAAAKSSPARASKPAAPKKAAKSSVPAGKKAPRKRTSTETVVSKTTEVLGEMLAGAAVGAVTGAAAQVGNEPTAVQDAGAPPASKSAGNGRSRPAPKSAPRKKAAAAKPKEVLNEMLTGAAVGAVAGAAKAVLPTQEKKSKGPAAKK